MWGVDEEGQDLAIANIGQGPHLAAVQVALATLVPQIEVPVRQEFPVLAG